MAETVNQRTDNSMAETVNQRTDNSMAETVNQRTDNSMAKRKGQKDKLIQNTINLPKKLFSARISM
jgi:hypothetical protein